MGKNYDLGYDIGYDDAKNNREKMILVESLAKLSEELIVGYDDGYLVAKHEELAIVDYEECYEI